MALSSYINLNDATPALKSFVMVSQDTTGALRIDDSTTLQLPRYMTIRHSLQKNKAGDITDRHLVQFSSTKADASGAQSTATLNFTLAVPRNGVVDRNEINHLIAFLVDFLDTDKVDAILRNER